MKKIALFTMFILMIGVTTATEINFFPDHGDIQKWCLIATDIFINAEWNPVAATDVVIETSLEYVDFVPSKELFPNFFPPKIKSGAIHIVWFISNPSKTITWSGSIGKLFLKQKNPTDTDGVVRLYFAWKGKTHDSNLSILWWIDVLQNVGSWYYQLLDQWSCEYPADYNIVWWFSHMSPEEALDNTMTQIQNQELINKIFNWTTLRSFLGLLIIMTVLFVYIKKWKHHQLEAK